MFGLRSHPLPQAVMGHRPRRSRSAYGVERERNDPAEHRAVVSGEQGRTVPGVDFDRVRAGITMKQVLNLLGFMSSTRSGRSGTGVVRCTSLERGVAARSR